MHLAHYHTQISREKLVKYRHNPDTAAWQEIGHVCETQERYYQPAVEALDAIRRKNRAV